MPDVSAEDAFERVLAGAAAGQGWAYTELYERHAGRVKAFAASRRVGYLYLWIGLSKEKASCEFVWAANWSTSCLNRRR